MLSRRALLVRLLCWTGASLAGPSFARAENAVSPPPDLARVRARGALRVGMTAADNTPFYGTNDAGELAGLDVDLARELASGLAVRLDFVRTAATYDEVVAQVARGEVDVGISALSATLERARDVAFTMPYLRLLQALLINRLQLARLGGGADPLRALDRPGVRIGTLAGSSYVGFAERAFPLAERITYPRWEDALAELQAGRLHAIMFDELEIKQTLRERSELALTLQAHFLKDRPDPIAVAVHWRDSHLRYWIDLFLATAKDDGVLARLRRRYVEGDR